MQTSRVILANEPRLLRGLLRRVIARTPGLQVVGEAKDPSELTSLVNECGAQWVVVPMWPEGLAPSVVLSLLLDQPALSVLGMAPDGSTAKIARTGSISTYEGLSLDEMLALMRKVGE
jgi:hypothetical protein